MTNEETEIGNMIGRPESGGAIVRTSQEVMTKWPPGDIPHRVIVTLVDDEAAPGFQRPESNGFIGGARKKKFGGC